MNPPPDSFRRPTPQELLEMESKIEAFQETIKTDPDSFTEDQKIAFAAEMAPFFASQSNDHVESDIETVRTR